MFCVCVVPYTVSIQYIVLLFERIVYIVGVVVVVVVCIIYITLYKYLSTLLTPFVNN